MTVRNVNPENLAWPDFYFEVGEVDLRPWSEVFAEFKRRLRVIDRAFEEKSIELLPDQSGEH
ncbi:MAG: hypothetical protein KDD69_13210 [Bdellovibrionales bacterium]|nr:hypothetical protein [Bdellovibrionales bacterium]